MKFINKQQQPNLYASYNHHIIATELWWKLRNRFSRQLRTQKTFLLIELACPTIFSPLEWQFYPNTTLAKFPGGRKQGFVIHNFSRLLLFYFTIYSVVLWDHVCQDIQHGAPCYIVCWRKFQVCNVNDAKCWLRVYEGCDSTHLCLTVTLSDLYLKPLLLPFCIRLSSLSCLHEVSDHNLRFQFGSSACACGSNLRQIKTIFKSITLHGVICPASSCHT